MAKHPAAFINAIAEEGTKEEAIRFLQKTWDELCDLRNVMQRIEQIAAACEADSGGYGLRGEQFVEQVVLQRRSRAYCDILSASRVAAPIRARGQE